jgi:hypothetical protein
MIAEINFRIAISTPLEIAKTTSGKDLSRKRVIEAGKNEPNNSIETFVVFLPRNLKVFLVIKIERRVLEVKSTTLSKPRNEPFTCNEDSCIDNNRKRVLVRSPASPFGSKDKETSNPTATIPNKSKNPKKDCPKKENASFHFSSFEKKLA